MSFLQKLLAYSSVCIQCHNHPDADALASAFGVYCYLKKHNRNVSILYGGPAEIKKSNLKMLINKCSIPVEYTHQLPQADLLLMVDCQYGQGNTEFFPAASVAIIDHHIPVVEPKENYFIDSSYQSCSTIIWEMLCEEGYPVCEDPWLSVALLYGLYTDTSSFADLYHAPGMALKESLLPINRPVFEQLIKANMSFAEFMIASEAMQNHYFDIQRRFAIVDALTCDQVVLGIIGDFIIQVDTVLLSFSYTQNHSSYQFSIRSCHESLPANRIAAFICDGIGTGGGHANKAGGYILKEKLREHFRDCTVFHIINTRICQYIDAQELTF